MLLARRDLALGILLGLPIGLLSIWKAGALVAAAALAVAALAWVLTGVERWVIAFFLAALLLPPLPLPWGDSGVHPALIFAVVGLWSGAVRLPEWRMRLDLVALALCILFAVLLASLPWALLYSGPVIAAGSLARTGLFGISLYLFFYLTRGPGREIASERILRLLFWAGVASATFAVVDFFFQLPAPARFAEQFVWLGSGVFRRAQGVFYEASTLGSFCAFLLTMVAVITVLRMTRRLRLTPLWLILGSSVLLAALIFSFSRAAIINLAVALIALICLERRMLRLAGGGVVSIAVGVSLARWLFPEFLNAYIVKIQHSTEFFLSDPNTVLSQRLDSWAVLVDYLRQNPWRSVLGIGYKTLPYTESLGRPIVADNMYLSLLIETGWLGAGALVLLNMAILFHSYRLARTSGSDWGRLCGTWMFCFWCGEMMQMATGDVLTYWRILPAFFAILALGSRDENSFSGSIQ